MYENNTLSPLPLVCRALCNSLTAAAVERVTESMILLKNGIAVFFGAADDTIDKTQSQKARKVIWFGQLPPFSFPLGVRPERGLPSLAGADACPACTPADHHTESAGRVVYAAHPLTEGVAAPLRTRPFTRFDFTDEWNNLGFGRIRTDGSIWSIHDGCVPDDSAVELAGLYLQQGQEPRYAGSYLTLLDTPERSCLWCARPVGPLDSTEWTIIERFISDWRADDMPCLPSLCSTPAGYAAIATMRLDCDEDISSARDVFEWYRAEGIPFSLAVKTCLPMTPAHLEMLRDVDASGGTLLSHSHTHPADWGGTFEAAKQEAETSRQWFRDNLPEAPVPDLAVSPFHTNPPCALQGIEAAGFTGVVSGIIHNDPEYLLGRAGIAPLTRQLATISQQSMLHGDCFAQQQESVDVHVQALDIQRAARGIFGYLDHPFSERYAYGWSSKAQRLAAHAALVEAIRARTDVLFWSQRQCFDFLRMLLHISLEVDECNHVRASGLPSTLPFRPECRFQGKTITL